MSGNWDSYPQVTRTCWHCLHSSILVSQNDCEGMFFCFKNLVFSHLLRPWHLHGICDLCWRSEILPVSDTMPERETKETLWKNCESTGCPSSICSGKVFGQTLKIKKHWCGFYQLRTLERKLKLLQGKKWYQMWSPKSCQSVWLQEKLYEVKTATGARGLPTSLHSRDDKTKKAVNAKLFWRSWEMCASRRKTGSHSGAKDREMLEETKAVW